MIKKSFELNKINLKKNNFFLFYGKNEGHKNTLIKNLINNKNVSNYDEKEILENYSNFIESLLTNSLFESEKIIIIKRATDKILKIIDEISSKNIDDIIIIIDADNLDKKSKLRSYFEKDKKYICVAFYPDNEQTLIKLSTNFLREKKISISQSNLNLIVKRCGADRQSLFTELGKLEQLSKTQKKITDEHISKLTNLVENFNMSELVDQCLAKNIKKTIFILNENNFTNEDCIIITKTFLTKSKKILKLSEEFQNSKNIDLTISTAKPPIFWKDKEIVKEQIYKWSPKKIMELIYKLSELELLIKKNYNNSINLVNDFILYYCLKSSNN